MPGVRDYHSFFDWSTLQTIIKRTFYGIFEEDLWGRSAEIAYDFIFSLFPGLMFIAALLSQVIDMPATTTDMLEIIGNFLPETIQTFVVLHLTELLKMDSGRILTISIVLILWLASNVVTSLIHNLNESYRIAETRSWWRNRLMAIAFVLSFGVVMIASFNLVVFGRFITSWIEHTAGWGWIVPWALIKLRYVIIAVILTLSAATLYTMAPNLRLHWVEVVPGSVLFAVLWLVSTYSFSFYLAHFGRYNKTYGTLGAVIILLLWMRIVALISLIGGRLNAEIHRQHVMKTRNARHLDEEIIPL